MITITGIEPAIGSTRNAKSALVEFSLTGPDINSSTLIVEISDARAVEGATFIAGYAGEYSEINVDEDLLGVVIDAETDFLEDSVIAIKIQIQDLNEKYYNFNYSFKVVSNKPYIFSSNPLNNDIMVAPQKLFFDIRDDVDSLDLSTLKISINNANVYFDSTFVSPFVGDQSELVPTDAGAEITVDPEEFIRDGTYLLRLEISDTSGNKLNQTINFIVAYTGVVLPAVFPQGGFVGFYQGIKSAEDEGNGADINLEWSVPASRYYGSDIYSLIYYSTSRLEIFDSLPRYITVSSVLSATLNEFRLGTGYYFAVRAMETYRSSIDTSGMEEKSSGIFSVPSKIILSEVLTIDGAIITVNSTDGYPEAGFLLIESEVVKYTSVDRIGNRFLLSGSARGLNNTTAVYHDSGTTAELFLLCQDDNNVIVYATASYQEPTSTGRLNNSIGLIVPDFSDFEKMEHDGLDHCGYHGPLPWQVLNGKNDCGSYLGGEYNGFRGLDIFQRTMDREEELMENVGEKCVLFRRLWSGETCSCVTLKRQHPKIRSCRFCYGTGYVGGYDQILNLRRADKRVMVRFYEAPEDLKLGDHTQLSQDFQPSALALFKPIIKDRDLVVRFDFTGDIEYIYEVLNVSRERFVFNKYGRQKLSILRLDKTDVIYQIPFEL